MSSAPGFTGDVSRTSDTSELDAIDWRLLDEFQRDFPLSTTPYCDIGARIGITEGETIERLEALIRAGFISRIGPVFGCRRLGVSTLAAMAIPEHRLESVARLVSAYPEVNHNYERSHDFNLWFVVTAKDDAALDAVLQDIAAQSGLEVIDLPLEQPYHIDLGFPLC